MFRKLVRFKNAFIIAHIKRIKVVPRLTSVKRGVVSSLLRQAFPLDAAAVNGSVIVAIRKLIKRFDSTVSVNVSSKAEALSIPAGNIGDLIVEIEGITGVREIVPGCDFDELRSGNS